MHAWPYRCAALSGPGAGAAGQRRTGNAHSCAGLKGALPHECVNRRTAMKGLRWQIIVVKLQFLTVCFSGLFFQGNREKDLTAR
jgi:hypothetical protein